MHELEKFIVVLLMGTDGHRPVQLLMIVPGEGGVGKSHTIQAISNNFKQKGMENALAKGAFMGIAATLIGGKTLHVLAQLLIKGSKQSKRGYKKLVATWQDKLYLIIDEMSMISCQMLARVSNALTIAKKLAGIEGEHKLFRGINIILVGDFHQFPPVFGRPLYWRLDNRVADEEDLLGWSIYKQFRTVVRLKQQMRVVDSEWLDMLQHVRNGNCGARHLDILHSVTISSGF